MKRKNLLSTAAVILSVLMFTAFKPVAGKLISKDTHISFYSHTPVEDITANNYKVVSTINPGTGDIVFSVPMQSFEFEKALMQKHFNSNKFLDTKKFPKSKFVGKIENIDTVEFTKDGSYPITVSGNLTIKNNTKQLQEKATIKVESGKITLESKTNVVLADFGITFSSGKPSTNIAKEVAVSVTAVYQTE